MTQNSVDDERDGQVRDVYRPAQDRSLHEAILDTIEKCKGEDLLRTDFDLYEDVNPDGLDDLFRQDAQPRTRVTFTTDDVQVELWGDGGVEIRVEARTVE
jgi:hypothetical protein